jgi:nucleoside-diphosphate-sugar epimerase
MTKTVVVTGAAGNLGRKICDHLAQSGRCDLRLLDLEADPARGVVQADLSAPSETWAAHLIGADTIVHLAANANPDASWDELIAPNLDVVLLLYLAAAKAGVRRIILASSSWVVRSYRFQPGVLCASTPPNPGASRYGATKLFAERVGKAFFDAHGLSTVVLRIGACLPPPNTQARSRTTSEWDQDCWLSDHDLCRGIEAALAVERPGFEIISLSSPNVRGRWALEGAAAPSEDGGARAARRPLPQRLRAMVYRLSRVFVPNLMERLVPWYW